jgi:hypothetical protein
MRGIVGIKVRLKRRITIRIALLSSYMFFDFEIFWNRPRRSFIAKSKNPPNTTTNLKSAIWKSYTDGEHGELQASMDESFFLLGTVTLTIAYLTGDWGVLLWNLWLGLSHTMWLSFDFLLTPTVWYMKSLFTAIYNTFPFQSCQRLQVNTNMVQVVACWFSVVVQMSIWMHFSGFLT